MDSQTYKKLVINDYINRYGLKINISAIDLLAKNYYKSDWIKLSRTLNTIHLLEKNPDKIDWSSLYDNPNAIHLLEKNPDKINWPSLYDNKDSHKINWP